MRRRDLLARAMLLFAALPPLAVRPLAVAKLRAAPPAPDAPAGPSGDFFGDAIAVDGDAAIIGAPGAGLAEIRERHGDRWLVAATFRGAPMFGETVAIAGDVAVVGGDGVHLYTRGARGWTERATSDDDAEAVGISGRQVLLLALDGDVVVLRIADLDLVTIEDVPLPAGTTLLPSSIAVDGARALIGTPTDDGDRGDAYLVERDRHGAWKLTRSFHGRTWFGVSVALDGDDLAIGDRTAGGPGAVHFYHRDRRDRWRLAHTLAPGSWVRGFGLHVALHAGRLAVLAPWDADWNETSRVFLYDRARAVATVELGRLGVAGDLAIDGGRLWLGLSNRAEEATGDGRAILCPWSSPSPPCYTVDASSP